MLQLRPAQPRDVGVLTPAAPAWTGSRVHQPGDRRVHLPVSANPPHFNEPPGRRRAEYAVAGHTVVGAVWGQLGRSDLLRAVVDCVLSRVASSGTGAQR